ncbi:glyoxalase [Candidatus Acetothermia bacterium]|nr:glyoxalase [Candidatus Acetothermia bacterium]MBI3642739.1 glyoxalase [Candidatus Acetothermia bacterium]
MEIVRLDHIQLAMPASEEAKARTFYGELLGLTEIPKPAPLAKRGGCWFQGAGFQVHLGIEEDFRPAKKAHPAFAVSDLEELRKNLERAGIEIWIDPATPDTKRFHAFDLFGNRLEFIQDGDRLFA